jgi:metal-sulfur cluster biosynthetic enzyme
MKNKIRMEKKEKVKFNESLKWTPKEIKEERKRIKEIREIFASKGITGEEACKLILEMRHGVENKTEEAKLVDSIDIVLKSLQKNISKEHRHSEVRLDCVECRFRVLEGLLEEYKELCEIGGETLSQKE